MASFLISLDVKGRACLVVGGDAEAARRAQRLLACGARVTVVWPEADEALIAWMTAEGVSWERRRPSAADLAARPFLLVSTPRDAALSAWLFAEAERHGVLVCCCDQLPFANYAHVAVADAGTVTVGVASGGTAPGLVARLRDALARGLDGEFAEYARHLAALRAATPAPLRRAALDAALDGLRAELVVRLPEGWRTR